MFFAALANIVKGVMPFFLTNQDQQVDVGMGGMKILGKEVLRSNAHYLLGKLLMLVDGVAWNEILSWVEMLNIDIEYPLEESLHKLVGYEYEDVFKLEEEKIGTKKLNKLLGPKDVLNWTEILSWVCILRITHVLRLFDATGLEKMRSLFTNRDEMVDVVSWYWVTHPVSDRHPSGRYKHAAVVIGEKLYTLFAGNVGYHPKSIVYNKKYSLFLVVYEFNCAVNWTVLHRDNVHTQFANSKNMIRGQNALFISPNEGQFTIFGSDKNGLALSILLGMSSNELDGKNIITFEVSSAVGTVSKIVKIPLQFMFEHEQDNHVGYDVTISPLMTTIAWMLLYGLTLLIWVYDHGGHPCCSCTTLKKKIFKQFQYAPRVQWLVVWHCYAMDNGHLQVIIRGTMAARCYTLRDVCFGTTTFLSSTKFNKCHFQPLSNHTWIYSHECSRNDVPCYRSQGVWMFLLILVPASRNSRDNQNTLLFTLVATTCLSCPYIIAPLRTRVFDGGSIDMIHFTKFGSTECNEIWEH